MSLRWPQFVGGFNFDLIFVYAILYVAVYICHIAVYALREIWEKIWQNRHEIEENVCK